MPVTPGGNVTSRTRTRALSRTILTVLWLLPLACGEGPAAVAIRGPLTRARAPRTPPSTRPAVKAEISLFIAVFYSASQDRIADRIARKEQDDPRWPVGRGREQGLSARSN